MSGERVPGKVFFETQSTHKMLAALSQASLIHIKGDYDEETFNEAYMMHTTTSPSYPLVASIETATAMLRGNPGKRLINRSVERALHFRNEFSHDTIATKVATTPNATWPVHAVLTNSTYDVKLLENIDKQTLENLISTAKSQGQQQSSIQLNPTNTTAGVS